MRKLSGPMGMGLSKSYEMGEKKFVYNTIDGQEKLILNDTKKLSSESEKIKNIKKSNE